MYLDICKKIGDILIRRSPVNQGLMNGKAGVSIFLYHLSEKLSEKKFSKHADSIMDEVYKKIPPVVDFFDGIIGIGWCIEYLIQNNFCEGETDEILEDIDNKIYKILCEQNRIPPSFNQGLIGYLQYLTMRLKNKDALQNDSKKINTELFRIAIDKIALEAPELFGNLGKDIRFGLFQDIYILFLSINSAYQLEIYNEKILNTYKQWESYWTSCIPYIHSHRLYLIASLFEINKILKSEKTNKHIWTLLYSIDINVLKTEVNLERHTSVESGYFGIILVLNKCIDFLDSTYPNYNLLLSLKEEILNLGNSQLFTKLEEVLEKDQHISDWDLGIMGGWSGIGLLLLMTPDVLENRLE